MAISGFGKGLSLLAFPQDGAVGEVLTVTVAAPNFEFDWLPGGGGGGQVDSVVGGVNINVNAADPINPIVNLDAALVGVSVNGVTLNAVGLATNFLNETGVYSVPPLDTAAADVLYLRLDTTNDPLTGFLTTQQIEADTNQTRDFGTAGATGRFNHVRGRIANFLGYSTGSGVVAPPAGTITFGADQTGFAGGNVVQVGTGITTFTHRGGGGLNPFKAVATIGNVFASGTGDVSMINNGGGSFLGGSAYGSSSGDILLTTTGFGNFTWAYAYTAGSNPHTFQNNASGSFMGGYSQGDATVNVQNTASAQGCFTWVRPSAGSGTTTINAINRGAGGFLQGRLIGTASDAALMEVGASALGGFVQGSVQGASSIRTTGAGGFAQGVANEGIILASGQGSFAHGRARVANAITASGSGSFAVGDTAAGSITASAQNSIQFGPGVNAIPNSLAVGDITVDGLRLRADATGTVDGDFFKSAGDVGFRSNGVQIGLFNQPSVTGSRAANAALASLLIQLAAMNVIADNTVV